MRIIHGGRGAGKTTKLIQMVKEFGGVLVVPTQSQKNFLITSKILAKDQVITFQEKRHLGVGFGESRKRYWIDQLDMWIEEMFGLGCEGFSMDTPDGILECDFFKW